MGGNDDRLTVLVVGGGGREHALAWKLAQSPRVARVLCAPGNAGIAADATCVPVKADDLDGLLELARRERVDLTVVGPEAPLVAGLVDRFEAAGLTAFGPTAAAARLEGSKAFAKRLMARCGVPSAHAEVFEDRDAAVAFVEEQGAPIVVKADGLAAGKGVVVAQTVGQARRFIDACLVERAFGAAGTRVVIEEYLPGQEASFLAITDGVRTLPLLPAQDHKTALDNDLGPNTGGMGAYCPAVIVPPPLAERITRTVIDPVVKAMAEEGCPFRGVLYAGLMVDGDDVRVLEFNVRFGDPETEPLLFLMESDLLPVLLGAARGDLSPVIEAGGIRWKTGAAVSVVMASRGYPVSVETGKPISGLDQVGGPDVKVFHAGTAEKDGRLVTAGGRVLAVTARGNDLAAAIAQAYASVGRISWEGVHYRRDIGRKGLAALGVSGGAPAGTRKGDPRGRRPRG
ncbi:MAG TPA: phosphoribosylamine--glycine ligase [Thermodesulfobacteriota bacterium]